MMKNHLSDFDNQLEMLERAHVEFQSDLMKHIQIHIQMFLLAVTYKVWKEALGQIPRIMLAVPGSILGLAPKGNVGSTKMGIFEKKV